MKLITRAGKAFRNAKLEHTTVEEITIYKYDEEGNIELDPETGEALTETEKKKSTVFSRFKYNLVDQTTLEKQRYLTNVWNQDCTFTIKTYDGIDPLITDRVIINDKAYTITNIYKDFDDSTASMYNDGGFYVIYIGLKGATSL